MKTITLRVFPIPDYTPRLLDYTVQQALEEFTSKLYKQGIDLQVKEDYAPQADA